LATASVVLEIIEKPSGVGRWNHLS
jgi:hypothetical protein